MLTDKSKPKSMRKIILSEHVSLDGFVAGPNGEMDWIKFNDEMFDLVGKFTDDADAAIYGRVTWQMMDAYWPTAAHKPDASKHDIEHSTWYNKIDKMVISKTMLGKMADKTTFVADNFYSEIEKLKKQSGKNILIFGSPGAVHSIMKHKLIDEFWLFINPVILGKGIPLFKNIDEKIELKMVSSKFFDCGVNGVNYILKS